MTQKLKKLSESQFLAFIWSSCALCILLTVLRGCVRWRYQRSFHSDDYWAFLGATSLLVMAIHYQLMLPALYQNQRLLDGLPLTVSPEKFSTDTPRFLKLLFSLMMFFWTTLWTVKASFLMLIKRLLCGLPHYRKWWWAVAIFAITMYLGSVANNFFSCLPLWRRWSIDPNYVCTSKSQQSNTNLTIQIPTAFDVACDIAILCLPVWVISSVMLSRSKKFGIIAMFALSVLVVMIAIIRVILVTGLGGQIDLVIQATWTWTESFVAMIIVNIPPLKVLVSRARSIPSAAKRTPGSSGFSSKFKRSISTQSKHGSHIELGSVGSAEAFRRAGSVDSEAQIIQNQNQVVTGRPTNQHKV